MSSEFEVLERLRAKFSLTKTGDDCAVLPKDSETDLVITSDMLVEDIDFRPSWAKPEHIGHKSLAVSLSDVAAMGAEPVWAMLSIGVPEHIWKSDFIDRFYEGWHALAAQFGVELVGGDVSKTPDKIVIDSTVAGEVPKGKAILRSTAIPGDILFVAGRLGLAAVGLDVLEGKITGPNGQFLDSSPATGIDTTDLLEKFEIVTKEAVNLQLQPTPQVSNGILLQSYDLASVMIDVSDGLAADLEHICKASGVGAVLEVERLLDPEISYPDGLPIQRERLDYILNGGEDFALLFAADPKKISKVENAGFKRIGSVTTNVGIIELSVDGKLHPLTVKGYTHF